MRRLPWVILGVAAVLCTTGIALLAQVPSGVLARADNSLVLSALFATILLVFGIVGALVASRLPSHPIGWLFLALALLEGIYELAFGYTHYTLHADPGALPGAAWVAWVSNWTGPATPPFIVAALLLFPDGRPPTARWRWVLWLCVPLVALIVMQYALAPGPIDEFPSLTNPAGVESAPWLADVLSEPLISALVIAAAAALVVRFRRSHGVERQQVKWVAFAAGLMALFLIVGGLARALVGDESADDPIAAGFVFAACICGVPVAAGVAILRHRLYDIDVVINRTLVYGALTATLAATYLGLVLLLGLAVGESNLAIAASTLAVAGLFRPARARIQAVVDRRFYRRRYDAARTLESFSGQLREELDLEAIGGGLREVVRETVQPTHVSLWLRSEA